MENKVTGLGKSASHLQREKYHLENIIAEMKETIIDKDNQIEVLLRKDQEAAEELDKWSQANHSLREEIRRIMDRSNYYYLLHI